MITTMDRAGRLVIPKAMREAAGLVPGQVDIEASDTAVTVTVPTSGLATQDGLLILQNGIGWDDDEVRQARHVVQR